MEVELKCPMCSEWYADPVILNCAHHVCQNHISSITQDSIVTCPVCRTPNTPTDEIRLDTTLRSIVKYWRTIHSDLSESNGRGSSVCGVCEKATATKSCKECHGIFCETCAQVTHSTGFYKTHKLITLAEGEFSDNFKLYCDSHPDERMNLFCADCKEPVCAHCFLVGDHIDHQKKGLKNAYDDHHKLLNEWCVKLEKVKTISTNFEANLNKLSTDIHGSFDEHTAHLDAIFNDMVKITQNKRDELLTTGAKIKTAKEKIIKNQQSSNDTLLARVNMLSKRALSIQSIANYHTFLTLYPPLVQDVKSMLNIRMNFTPETDSHFNKIQHELQLSSLKQLDNPQSHISQNIVHSGTPQPNAAISSQAGQTPVVYGGQSLGRYGPGVNAMSNPVQQSSQQQQQQFTYSTRTQQHQQTVPRMQQQTTSSVVYRAN